jgi:hypothetical protein
MEQAVHENRVESLVRRRFERRHVRDEKVAPMALPRALDVLRIDVDPEVVGVRRSPSTFRENSGARLMATTFTSWSRSEARRRGVRASMRRTTTDWRLVALTVTGRGRDTFRHGGNYG